MIDDVDLELFEVGAGTPVLVLHGGEGFRPDDPWIELLARDHRVVAASHPGFGQSTLPSWMDSVDDLVYLYCDLVEARDDLTGVTLLGFSLGGWLAAELAVRRPPWLKRLVLVDAVGIKVGGREDRDIQDIWAHSPGELARMLFHDPDRWSHRMDVAGRTTEELDVIARNQETVALFAWEPYFHNPKLRRRLQRIDVPALVIWGEDDGLVSRDYGQAFAASIPGAAFVTIAEAGHLPQVEQPARFVEHVASFIQSSSSATAQEVSS